MIRGLWSCIFGLALLSLAGTASADALGGPILRHQDDYRYRDRTRGGFEGRTMLRIHAGISSPTGDFGDAFNTGLGIGGSVGYGLGRNTVLSGGVAYHHFGSESDDGHVNIVPITASIDYGFSTSGKVRPWISGGLGIYNVSLTEEIPPFGSVSDSEADFGVNFGFGIATRMGDRNTFGAGLKFHHIEGNDFPDTDFFALQAGLAFPL
jgi:opacity protein-like surface antigen